MVPSFSVTFGSFAVGKDRQSVVIQYCICFLRISNSIPTKSRQKRL